MSNIFLQKTNENVDVSEIVNKQTGEMLAKIEIGTITPEIFIGISTLDISKEISDKLTASVPLDGIEIKPTGQIYLCHIQYRRMLNDAFGMGNWALRPLGGFQRTIKTKRRGEQNEEDTIIVCREYALYIRGKYASSAIGEQEYIESNDMMSASDACEGTESNAIMRCCKKLGIGLEMWDKKFVAKFIKDYCVQVWRKGKSKPQYRLKDAEPWFDETGIMGSKEPNPEQGEKHKPSVTSSQTKTGNQSNTDELISEAQGKRFYAIAKGAGWNDSDLKAWLIENYGIDSTKKITKTIYEDICEKVKIVPKREPGLEG